MKILLVTGSFPPMHCGVGDYAARLSIELARDPKIQVSVLSSKIDPLPPSEPAIRVLRTVSTWESAVIGEFRRVAHQVRPDLVHVQFPTQGYNTADGLVAIVRETRQRLRLPVVATLHEFIPRGFTKPERAILWIALRANKLVAVRPGFHRNMPWYAKAVIRRSKVEFIANASVIPRAQIDQDERTQIRARLDRDSRKLVTFFGFAYPAKGVDLLFDIADPAQHHLLLICDLSIGDPYHAKLRALAESERWKGSVTLAGFAGTEEVARLLAASDAAVFPYRDGGGPWNSSLHAAMTQDTFVLTTSSARKGYDTETNTYYTAPSDVAEMRRALLQYAGVRRQRGAGEGDPWQKIAARHKDLYLSLLSGGQRP